MEYFTRICSVLGDRRGPTLFQLAAQPEEADLPRLTEFLKLIPRRWQATFEFRHPTWFNDAGLRCAQAARLCALHRGSRRLLYPARRHGEVGLRAPASCRLRPGGACRGRRTHLALCHGKRHLCTSSTTMIPGRDRWRLTDFSRKCRLSYWQSIAPARRARSHGLTTKPRIARRFHGKNDMLFSVHAPVTFVAPW